MATPAVSSSILLRFGPFELDPAGCELRKAGITLKLHPQPFRVLLLLVERPGQIVTREEIQHCLWGDNTFVDFEAGINFCVKQLRGALSDNVEDPRYIQTLPRRGYRFIAPVTRGDRRTGTIPFERVAALRVQPDAPDMTEREKIALPSEIHVLPAPLPLTLLRRLATKNSRAAIVALGVAAILAAGAILHLRSPAKLTEKDTIVLADFLNNTEDPVFDDSLRQATAIELGQSPFLKVLPENKASKTLQMMDRPENARMTPELGREVCLRTGSKALLYGSISRLGSHYLLSLNAVACNNGDKLAQVQTLASGKDDVLISLSRAVSQIRAGLGESLPSVQKLDVPIQATTNSLEALQEYSRAAKIGFQQGDAPGIPLLKRAIELDPNFAMAYAALARRYSNLDQPSLSLAYATRAYALRDRVTERERLGISAAYFRATGSLESLSKVFEQWAAEYPRDAGPHGSLGANYAFLGQYDKALSESQQALRLSPDNVINYVNLGGALLDLNRLGQARAVFDQAFARKFDGEGLHQETYFLAFLQGDSREMARQVAWAAGQPDDEPSLLSLQSETEAFYGRLGTARELSQRSVSAAVRSNSKEEAALYQVIAGLREAEVGETSQAKQDVRDALALAEGRDVKVMAALALARIGDSRSARTLAEDLEKSNPSNTLLNVYWLPVIHAALELRKGNAAKAATLLEVAAPYQLGHSPSLERGTLYPCYLRGQAYLMEHKGSAAAAQFQEMLDHPGIAVNFVTESLARFQLARAYALAGNAAKAKAAYQEFLMLWREGDEDVFLLQQAKAEYARLQ